MHFMVADVNKEIQALRASKAAKNAKLKAYEARIEAFEAQLKVRMAAVTNVAVVYRSKCPLSQKRIRYDLQHTMGQGTQGRLPTSF